MPDKDRELDGFHSTRQGFSPKTAKKKDSLEELLNPKKRIQSKLENTLGGIAAPKVLLLLVESEHYAAVQEALLDFLRPKNGVFVSVNKPIGTLSEEPNFVSRQNKWVFVDMVSESAGIPRMELANARYLESPQNMLELTMLTEKELKAMPLTDRFVVLDSLSTLLLYNKDGTVERFVHNLAGKIRALQTIAILIMVQLEENKDTIRVISQFCDQTIEISENEGKTK